MLSGTLIGRQRQRRLGKSTHRPSLSVCCLTGDPGPRVAAILELFRPAADEVVIAADSRASESDLAAYATVADHLLCFEFSYTERHLGWLHAQCSCDWIFRIDGDEVPSPELIEALPGLISSPRALQYWFTRRWLFPDAAHWLDELPWCPDFQCRLVRNDGTLRFPGTRHSSAEPLLPRRYIEAPLYHLDLAVNDADTRRRKIALHAHLRPGLQAPGGGPHDEVYYLPERHARSAPVPVPEAHRSSIDRVLGARAGGAVATAAEVVSSAQSDRFWMGREQGDARSELADIQCLETDLRMYPGEARAVHFRVANAGASPWPWEPDDPGRPQVRFSYHVLDEGGNLLELDGVRSLLPERLGPGDETIVPAMVRAPATPGSYLLEADLVWHRWFGSSSRHLLEVAEDASRSAAAADEGHPPSPEAYGERFYSSVVDGAARSASRTLPLVFDLVKPSSVIDVGCGTGAWLAVARELGASEILGIDGDWVPSDALLISADRFRAADLAVPMRLGRRFDLAICMEVAEHLDATSGDSLVRELCAAADVVLFSAAIPGQTGSDHRNEQWPTYWRERFRSHGHEMVDCLRRRLWGDELIEPWYAQNAYLYVARRRIRSDRRLRSAARDNGGLPLSAVHPGVFRLHSGPTNPSDPEPREQRPAPRRFESGSAINLLARRVLGAVRHRL
jgi:SAM-dependent methyltransferase